MTVPRCRPILLLRAIKSHNVAKFVPITPTQDIDVPAGQAEGLKVCPHLSLQHLPGITALKVCDRRRGFQSFRTGAHQDEEILIEMHSRVAGEGNRADTLMALVAIAKRSRSSLNVEALEEIYSLRSECRKVRLLFADASQVYPALQQREARELKLRHLLHHTVIVNREARRNFKVSAQLYALGYRRNYGSPGSVDQQSAPN